MDTDEALSFTQKLTGEHSCRDVGDKYESSSGECYFKPEIPQYAGKHIAVKVGDLQEICPSEEDCDSVSNLLDT